MGGAAEEDRLADAEREDRLVELGDDPDPLPAGQVGLGLEGCRANFRDCVIYPDLTWKES